MPTQAEKGTLFRALHHRDAAFIIPNPWDAGSARILAHLGFEALATTSAGYAFSQGERDATIGGERMMAHVAEIAAATPLPVSADLENGYGDEPEAVAETIRRAAAAGAVGASIEDATGRPDGPIYGFGHAVARIQAAAEAARGLGYTFTLTARAENFLLGNPDLKDTIRRLQAYQAAGADVLYAPSLTTAADIAAVVAAVDLPVNVLGGIAPLDLAALSALGVRRVSAGSTLARAAYGALLAGARELRSAGSFGFVGAAAPFSELTAFFTA